MQIGEFGRRDLSRLLVFVKQMAGEEAERDFSCFELLAQRPWLNVSNSVCHLAKGLLVVKQAVLVRVVGGVAACNAASTLASRLARLAWSWSNAPALIRDSMVRRLTWALSTRIQKSKNWRRRHWPRARW